MSLGQRQLPWLVALPLSLPLLIQPLREDGQRTGLGLGARNAVSRPVPRLRLGSADTSAVADEQEGEGRAGPGRAATPILTVFCCVFSQARAWSDFS